MEFLLIDFGESSSCESEPLLTIDDSLDLVDSLRSLDLSDLSDLVSLPLVVLVLLVDALLFGGLPFLERPTSVTEPPLEFNNTGEESIGDGDSSFPPPGEDGGDTVNREIGRAVQQECRDRSRMPSSA
eukprot:TRINITY_DN48840_c0_g1_i1.p1 TRINITY_DN48840_c0_g1~~TRINITY_DN48840_c0_g1_i1.p1  ORF type:complete len:128 (+),score=7.28 TRINITY_DN48840_c0_g1_i1:106-489(+)